MQNPQTPPPTDGSASNPYGDVPAGTAGQPSAYPPSGSAYSSGSVPPGYTADPNRVYPTALPPAGASTQGLSDTAAGTIAYLTIIPAIVFLVLAPYNTRPFVKFHAIQCLGLAVVWFCLHLIGIIPILGLILLLVGYAVLVVVWILCLIKASQGSYLKLPVISDFAAQQSGFPLR